MSNFDIKYNFIAIDRFTKVARKIQREAARISSNIGQTTKSLNTHAGAMVKASTGIQKSTKSLQGLGNITEKMAKKTNVGMKSMAKSVEQGKRSFSSFAEFVTKKGDELAFSGYIQFMNIGMPIMLAGKMGMTYAKQMEQGQYLMRMGLGGEKNYGQVAKGITRQAGRLSGARTGFTSQQVMYTAGMLANTFGRPQWTKDLIKAALVQEAGGLQPQQAVQSLKAIILKGGKYMGEPIIGGASLAAKTAAEQRIVQITRSQRAQEQLTEYAKSSAAQLTLLGGAFQKMAGTILIQATPALSLFATHLTAAATVSGNFLQRFPKISEGLLTTAFVGLGATVLKTLAGSFVSIFAFALGIIEKFGGAILINSRFLRLFQGSVEAATIAEDAQAVSFRTRLGKIGKLAKGPAFFAVADVGMAAVGYGAYKLGEKRKAQYISESQRLAYVRAHGFGGKMGKAAVFHYAIQKSLEGGAMSGGGMTIPGLPGSVSGLTPVQHKIDMEIKVDQEGKVKSVHAYSPTLGLNMSHAVSPSNMVEDLPIPYAMAGA